MITDSVSLEIIILISLILLNGLLAMSELAVVSSNRNVLEKRASSGSRSAKIVLRLLDSPGIFLSTVQAGITLIGIISGVYAGATLTDSLNHFVGQIPLLAPHGYIISYSIVVLGITYFSLVLGELVPKQIALSKPETVAQWLAPTIYVLSLVLRPIVWILEASASLVMKLFPSFRPLERKITEEEVKLVIAQAAKTGVIEHTESMMAQKVFRMGDRPARSIMTPRPEVIWIKSSDTPEEAWAKVSRSEHSYFPVAHEDFDSAVSVVSVREVSRYLLMKGEVSLLSLAKEPLRIPGSLTTLKVLDLFKEKGDRLGLVIDEHGAVEGVISLHDVMESLVGDISGDELEAPAVIKRSDGSSLVDASINLEDLFTTLHISGLSDDDHVGYHSLGGFVMRHLKRLPKAGDRFDYADFTFEVADMDRFRVDKVLIYPKRQSTEERKTDSANA